MRGDHPVAVAALTVDRSWALTGVEEGVARYEVDDLATGLRRVVLIAGEVVVGGDDVELAALTR
jgi:hypothetical protein